MSLLKLTFLKPTDAPFQLLYTGFMITLLSVHVHAQMTAHTHFVDYCHPVAKTHFSKAHRFTLAASLYHTGNLYVDLLVFTRIAGTS